MSASGLLDKGVDTLAYGGQLSADHPGFTDAAYRARRQRLSEVAAGYRRGQPVPDAPYSSEDDALWTTCAAALVERHERHACEEFQRGVESLALPTDHVPQLTEVSALLEPLTGFRYEPVPGLVSPADFYGALGEGWFMSTQYIRHHSVPSYTPEPDVVHEVVGHANQLARPRFADIYRGVGEAAKRVRSDAAMEFLSRVFWFTIEFGVVHEAGELKAYGAGILSSFGELEAFRDADVRPFDLAAMGRQAVRHHDVPAGAVRGGLHRRADRRDDRVPRLVRRRCLRPLCSRPEPVMSGSPASSVGIEAPAAHLLGWDCIEFWVGNARAMTGFLMSAFGFRCAAYAGPETGVREKSSYVLEQGDIRFVISGALDAGSPIAVHVRTHGDGVHDLAWVVDDAVAVFRAATARGASVVSAPWEERDGQGTLRLAQIAAYGETVHTFVDRSDYRGPRLEPGYVTDDLPPTPVGPTVGLTAIDHVVGNVEQGHLTTGCSSTPGRWASRELVHFSDDQISTEYSALMSTVVWDGTKIVMPINEPADGLGKSQIQEYIETYDGPGVQHIALRTDDIVATVGALRDRGVRFMRVPDTYYDEARNAPRRRRPALGRAAAPQRPRGPRSGRLPAADLHGDGDRPADRVLRDHRAPGRPRLRRGQLQGAVRGHRARPGPSRQPMSPAPSVTPRFGPSTLPYGVADGRVVTRLADGVVPVGDVIADDVFEQPSLNRFMAEGPEAWAEARRALTAFVARSDGASFTPVADVELGLPFEVGDFVDFYSSLHHASNLGRLFRPGGDPLLPNWRRLPVGYHGRSGTVVRSGTTVMRPTGLVQTEGGVERRPALPSTSSWRWASSWGSEANAASPSPSTTLMPTSSGPCSSTTGARGTSRPSSTSPSARSWGSRS